MPSYSLDLRQKVVESYENKEGSIRTIAKRFKVSKDFVQRLLKRYSVSHICEVHLDRVWGKGKGEK